MASSEDTPRIALGSGLSLTAPELTAVTRDTQVYYFLHLDELPPEIVDAGRAGVFPLFEIHTADRSVPKLIQGNVQRVWQSAHGGWNVRVLFSRAPVHETVAENTPPLPDRPVPTPQQSRG